MLAAPDDVDSFWLNPQIYPVYAVAFSATTLVLHGILVSKPMKRLRATWASSVPVNDSLAVPDTRTPRGQCIARVGGPAIFAWKVARLLATLALFALAVHTAVQAAWTTFDVVKVVSLVRRLC